MSRFFLIFAIFCTLLYLATLTQGYLFPVLGFPVSAHVLMGLLNAFLVSSLHCLIFGIFTGSGKEARETVQGFELDKKYILRTKAFKRRVFPPALYSILWLMLVTGLGGWISSLEVIPLWLRWAHSLAAWGGFIYNVRTFIIEYRCVVENAEIVQALNRQALGVPADQIPEKVKRDLGVEVVSTAEDVKDGEWETHVYALGRFLRFLGYNAWLPYLYIRFIMGKLHLPLWPFLLFSVVCLAGGFYLIFKYRPEQPAVS